MSWSTSTRKSRLPENWEALRLEVRDRAGGRCEYADANGRCTNIGNQCDHIIRGDDHSKANLQKAEVQSAADSKEKASSHPGTKKGIQDMHKEGKR